MNTKRDKGKLQEAAVDRPIYLSDHDEQRISSGDWRF
jgi:hypothetical protein